MRRFFSLCLLSLVVAACSRGPGVETVTEEIQQTLDTRFQEGLFKVISVNRQGSTPISSDADGKERLLVYYNATLEFLKDYSLKAGGDLNLASLANVLGATEKGIQGFKTEGNKSGDELKVHGRSTYALINGDWQPQVSLSRKTARAPAPDMKNTGHPNTAPPSGATTLIKELDNLVKTRTGVRGREARIVEEELNSALRSINFRIARGENVSVLTSGEPLGEYFRVGQALQDFVSGPELTIRNYLSAGSVENCDLVEDHTVDLGIVQNDVAATAYAGVGIFEERGPMTHLRALASLFPEQMQIVVLKSSNIHTIADLKGTTIDIGLPRSGSRVNALQVLQAHGLKLADFTIVTSKGFAESIDRLKAGTLDAFFVTLAAPARQLHNLSATHPIRLLSLDPEVREQLLVSRPYYVASVLPANTYTGQTQAAETLSVKAMLIANKNVPNERIEALLDGLFTNVGAIAKASFQASAISRQSAERGISIPLHPAAKRYFAP